MYKKHVDAELAILSLNAIASAIEQTSEAGPCLLFFPVSVGPCSVNARCCVSTMASKTTLAFNATIASHNGDFSSPASAVHACLSKIFDRRLSSCISAQYNLAVSVRVTSAIKLNFQAPTAAIANTSATYQRYVAC